ncbi:DNA mismatch repair protein MutS [Methylobacterium nonmethylotrophicum]|uniref:DNA mismatch repair protein MutS n=2 Tax=Methylobacterium nonmethylotrophicum TaxID=1141884 RepID=A0A4Z0NLZ7_9HYPH|nr:Smr/MutS family protein [Methylobacterium nonmethylotrophicum]TGD97495.1 DNA mismatch repair protein MutS [Methylobacterium nonmethylotrophicum]
MRRLSSEESRLWAEISRLITPLRGRPSPPPPEPAPTAPEAQPARPGPRKVASAKTVPVKTVSAKTVGTKMAGTKLAAATAPAAVAPKTPPPAPALPPLAPLERRVRTGLRRGSRSVDAVIDLHGLRQAEAHATLVGFLHRSRAAGHTVVLVVTGKGGSGDDPYAERGVLRRSVPHWLRLPELRALVLGFEEAAHHHGGGGALYIRLRRR